MLAVPLDVLRNDGRLGEGRIERGTQGTGCPTLELERQRLAVGRSESEACGAGSEDGGAEDVP